MTPMTSVAEAKLRDLEEELNNIHMDPKIRRDDIDGLVEHIVRVNDAIQEVVWHGGFKMGSDKSEMIDTMIG